jgi:hypothetical protein
MLVGLVNRTNVLQSSRGPFRSRLLRHPALPLLLNFFWDIGVYLIIAYKEVIHFFGLQVS